MKKRAKEAIDGAKGLAELVDSMINDSRDLDLQRLLKQIEADLMDIQHKLSIASRLIEKE